MNQSLSCNSLKVYHYATPSQENARGRSAGLERSKKLCLASRSPTSTQSEFKFRNQGARKCLRRPGKIVRRASSKKTVISSHWTSRYDFLSISAPTSSRNLGHDSSSATVISHTEQLIPEREKSMSDCQNQRELLSQNLNQQLEELKAELKQCQEASQFSESQVYALSDELKNVRATTTAERERLYRQLHASTKTINDQKATIKNLNENSDIKDSTIMTLKNSLVKSEASNASRSATIKTLKNEITSLRKDLAESSTVEGILQKCNKDLMADNKRLKGIMEDMKTSIALLQQSNSEWEEIVDKQLEMLTKEGESNHLDCRVITSQKLGSLKASYDHRVQLLLKKLFRADRKTKQLYQTIEKIIKGVHSHLFSDELKDLVRFDVMQHMEGGGDLPLNSVVLCLGSWMDAVHELAYKKRFSSDLAEFILNLIGPDADTKDTDQ